MTRRFPCPICKGKGNWVEPVTDEGYGPVEWCSYCDGDGSLEIGGKLHKKHAAVRIAMEILKFSESKKELYTWEELEKIGKKALSLTN